MRAIEEDFVVEEDGLISLEELPVKMGQDGSDIRLTTQQGGEGHLTVPAMIPCASARSNKLLEWPRSISVFPRRE